MREVLKALEARMAQLDREVYLVLMAQLVLMVLREPQAPLA